MDLMCVLRLFAARLEKANEGPESRDIARDLRTHAHWLEKSVLADPAAPDPDSFIGWLRLQTKREDKIGALARFVGEKGASVATGHRDYGQPQAIPEQWPLVDALQEFHRETMRASLKGTPNRLYSVRPPSGL
ncbi:hypothetical protein LZC95_48485 [Pendulispora brunnea]|uniref:Uncharacterized protein n=1 Tax=Pendulispora brunnea TaxID=2905690 RepID=A0ABZ2K6F8_9BACT